MCICKGCIQRVDLVGQRLVAACDCLVQLGLGCIELVLYCLNGCIQRCVRGFDLCRKLCLVVCVCRFKCRLCIFQRSIQVSDLGRETVIPLLHRCIEIVNCLVQLGLCIVEVGLYVVDRRLEGALCTCDLAFKLSLIRSVRCLERGLCCPQRIGQGRDLPVQHGVAGLDGLLQIGLGLIQLALHLCNFCIQSGLCLGDLAFQRGIARDSGRLCCVNRLVQGLDRICKGIRIGGICCLQILNRLVQVCLNLGHLSLKCRVCSFNLGVQLCLKSRIGIACRLLCIGNCPFQRFDCILQRLCICRIGCLQIFNRRFNFVNSLFRITHSCIKRSDQIVCLGNFAFKLLLQSRVFFIGVSLCYGLGSFDCRIQSLYLLIESSGISLVVDRILKIGLCIVDKRFSGRNCLALSRIDCRFQFRLQSRILRVRISLGCIDQCFQICNSRCKLVRIDLRSDLGFKIRNRIFNHLLISLCNIALSRIDCRCKLCVGCAVLFKRGDLCGDLCKLRGNVCRIRLVCNQIVQLVDIRLQIRNLARKVSHADIEREGEHLRCAIVAARMGDYGNHQLILAADHCSGRYGYFESVEIASKVADLCAFDSDKIGEHLVLDARQGVGKEDGVTGENRGNGSGNVQGRRCFADRDCDILHCNTFVIVIARDPVQHAIGACFGLSLGVRAGTNDFFPNVLGNSNAIIHTAIYCILHGSAGSRARGCDCLQLAVVDQILNRGGRGHNGGCFCDGKAADLKVGHSLVVIALGDTDFHGVSACVGRAFHLAAVLVVLNGDISHTDDAVFRFDKRRLCGAVVDCAVGHSAAEIVCLRRCLLNGIGRIRTARVVALAHNRDGVTAGTDRPTVRDHIVILTALKRNAANGDDHGGTLCHAVVFGIRYGDNSFHRKIRALLYGKVFHLIFIKIGDYRAGIDDLTVLVVEIIVLGENVRRGLSG